MYAIQTRRLTKTYGAGETEVPVLKGVNLDIKQGEFVSIMGPSGSGKSTLLNMIGLLDTPTGGGIRLLEGDVHKLHKNQRAAVRQESLGFVFQAFHLMPRATALQNVMLPMALAGMRRADRRSKAEQVLEAVGLGDRMKHQPSELSGGQKQRVAIARALALDPPILLADEPTGNLDSTTSRDIMKLFQSLHAEGKTVVQVTHEPTMARYGQRIIRFQDGIIARNERVGGQP
ncbi:MAG: ABC transporter ATP-binding protein [Thermoplasmatota archaeon]